MISSDRGVWTTIFPDSEAVALKLREGVSPQELVESVLRKYILHPKDPATFEKIGADVESALRKHGVSVQVTVGDCEEAPHGVVVSIRRVLS